MISIEKIRACDLEYTALMALFIDKRVHVQVLQKMSLVHVVVHLIQHPGLDFLSGRLQTKFDLLVQVYYSNIRT